MVAANPNPIQIIQWNQQLQFVNVHNIQIVKIFENNALSTFWEMYAD